MHDRPFIIFIFIFYRLNNLNFSLNLDQSGLLNIMKIAQRSKAVMNFMDL